MRISYIIIIFWTINIDTYGIVGRWKILRTLCVELTYFATLNTFKVSVIVSTVKNMGLAKQETC